MELFAITFLFYAHSFVTYKHSYGHTLPGVFEYCYWCWTIIKLLNPVSLKQKS